VDDVWLRFQTLTGLFWFESARGNFSGACNELSLELLDIAGQQSEPAFSLQASHARGLCLLQTGQPAVAEQHFSEGLTHFDPLRHQQLSHWFGQNPGVMCLGFRGMNLALMGRTDEGAAQADEALRWAEQFADPPSIVFSHFFRLFVAAVRRDPAPATRDGPAYLEYARDTPFSTRPVSRISVTRTRRTVKHAEGIDELHAAISAFRASGGLVLVPTFCSLLADLLLSEKRFDEALRQIEDGLTIAADSGGNSWYDPELLRLRAAAMLQRGDSHDSVTAAFIAAIDCARRQGAAPFELRALIDVVRAGLILPGRDARAELAALHARLEEENHMADVRNAADLLASSSKK
jgi:tetratricopeptide (TPR) repeat protein